ncbi:MAG: SusD/RagB family nutrient-binding outer membrane lipoprotein [Candidatus Symbiothrix sp.]|jgi:hypothetical protein|nr:SusD/RagB family nutrient-binding outer membrane lipoprotein [Candidatus Symbiothrix sp.]
MKKIFSEIKYLLLGVLISLFVVSCEDMEKMNTDPNNPSEVASSMVFSGAQKRAMDYVYDLWFSGRQCMVYSQYWVQRNYTEEDRYQIRESVNNSYFNAFYTVMASFDKVIELNSNPETAESQSVYGNNNNQIAAAKIMKAWLYLVMTDTWGNIPYSDAGKLKDDVYYPKYDDQQDIYYSLLAELELASDMIDESEVAFIGGDMVYFGDASAWKKFANSLRCRIACHISKVDASWASIINDAVADGVFESNDDVAAYHYSSTAPEQSYYYRNTFVDARNDFTVSRPFMDILKGQKDTLNNKSHPWEGVRDPRLEIYIGPGNTDKGQPYGIPSSLSSKFRAGTPNWYNDPPYHLAADCAMPLMTYAEVQFIISESKGFSQAEYETGVEASIDYWSSVSGTAVDATTYLAAVSTAGVDAEKLSLQKYIDLYLNGTEAWTEIRRTGYPAQIINPDEITVSAEENGGTEVKFVPLSDTKGLIIPRVKYPTNESTLNGENFNAAVAKLKDGTNNYYSQMFWDIRTTDVLHPANK